MTISSTLRKAGPFVGNGIATVFAFTYKVFTSAEVVVTKAVTATGVESVLTLNTHYSVALNADQNTNPGGNVTYPISGSPLPSTETLTLTSGVSQTQETDIVNAGGFFPEVIENALDRNTIITQQETEKANRTLRFPVSDTAVNVNLPPIAQRASKVLGFDAGGAPTAVTNVPTSGVVATPFTETFLDDTTALAARQTLLIDKHAADVATAATVDLDTPAGDLVDLTGAVTITAITLGDGREKTVRLTGAPLITHGASLVCPGNVNIQGFAGDTFKVRGYASGVVRIFGYQPFETALIGKIPTTAGDILVATAARTFARKGIGADGEVAMVDSAAADKLTYTKLGAGDVRQTVLSSAVDSSGYAAGMTTGSGLRPGLDASPTPMVLAMAAGFGAMGANDLVSVLSADASDPLGVDLSASNTSFLHADYATKTTVTWGKTLVPPQYGYTFDRTQNTLLHFDGTDASTVMLDDFGNTWTAVGNAQIDTAQFKFGASSLLLDGTGDYIKNTQILSLGGDSWEMSCWSRFSALGGAGSEQIIFTMGSATVASIGIRLTDVAGTKRLNLYASSNGSSHDIANAVAGTNTTWAIDTWYKFRVAFDALAGTYRVYFSNNGAAESQDISVSSTARVFTGTKFLIGIGLDEATFPFFGWIDEFRLIRGATVTATETPKASAYAVNEANQLVNFFSIPEMKMYEVTSASVTAGVNPGMTARNRVFVGEADTSGAAVTAVRNYALRGRYDSYPINTIPAVNTVTFSNHNLGLVENLRISMYVECVTGELGYLVGDRIEHFKTGAAAYNTMTHPVNRSRNRMFFVTLGTTALIIQQTSGSDTVGTSANWRWGTIVERTF